MVLSDTYTKLHGHSFLSKCDMTKGYWQIPLEENSQQKTGFLIPKGSFCFLNFPFGLVNTAATFKKIVRKLLKGLLYSDSYLDDILCHTPSWEDYLDELRRISERLNLAKFTVKQSECQIGFKNLTFVGNQISELGMKPEESRSWTSAPVRKKNVLGFLVFLGYYSKHIPNFNAVAAPLSDLTNKGQPNRVVSEEPQEKAFRTLNEHLVRRRILHLPDFSRLFILQCDTRESGIGAALVPEYGEGKCPV